VPGGASELGLTLRCALSILEQDAATETPKRPDQVLWTAVWGLSAVQRGLDRLLYRWQARRFFGFPDNANQYFNYLYVSEWFVIFAGLSTLQAFVGSGLWVTALVAALVLWRGSEIIVWYAKMLLDWGHKLLLSAERNLLFLIANTAEMAWILALLISLQHTHCASLGSAPSRLSPSTHRSTSAVGSQSQRLSGRLQALRFSSPGLPWCLASSAIAFGTSHCLTRGLLGRHGLPG
jgi:hypothetical protein